MGCSPEFTVKEGKKYLPVKLKKNYEFGLSPKVHHKGGRAGSYKMRGETFPKLKTQKHPEGIRLVTSLLQDTLAGCNSPASHIYALGKL